MAGEITWLLGIAFGKQSALGTVNATIRDLAGSLAVANGLVLGSSEDGVGESGITYAEARRLREKAPVTGSFTAQPSTFLAVDLQTLTFAFEMCGSRNTVTTPITASDVALPANVGIDALLQAAGLLGADSGTPGRLYSPANAVPLTLKLWLGNDGTNALARVWQDCFVNLSIDYTPGDVPIATATITGVETTSNGYPKLVATPTFAYGVQASISASVVQSVGFSWGQGAIDRDFESLVISIDNEIEELASGNSPGGKRKRQTGRTITLTAKLLADSTDSDFELQELRRTTSPVDALEFQVGPSATDTNPALGHIVRMPTPELRQAKPDKYAVSVANEIILRAVSTSANSEFTLELV